MENINRLIGVLNDCLEKGQNNHDNYSKKNKYFSHYVSLVNENIDILITEEAFLVSLGKDRRISEHIINKMNPNNITIQMYWQCFYLKDHSFSGFCCEIIRKIGEKLISMKMYNEAFEVEAFDLCGVIIERIKRNLITAEMFDKALEHGEAGWDLCETIIWNIEQTLITTEIFDKALEAGAVDLCKVIICYIHKDLITVKVFNKAFEAKKYSLCDIIVQNMNIPLIKKHLYEKACQLKQYDKGSAVINCTNNDFLTL